MDIRRRHFLKSSLTLAATPGLGAMVTQTFLRSSDAVAQSNAAGPQDSDAPWKVPAPPPSFGTEEQSSSAQILHNLRYEGIPVIASALTPSEGFADDARQLRLVAEAALNSRRFAQIRVRAGGHSYIGASVARAAYVLNLAPFSRCKVLSGQNQVRIGAGARLADLELVLNQTGPNCYFPVGDCPTVGLAGYLLGGGISMLSPQLGLGVDQVEELNMVVFKRSSQGSYQGQELRVSRSEHADLFWARLGGGGQFGLVTDVTLRFSALPDSTVYTITGITTPESFPALFAAWQQLCASGLDPTSSTKLQLSANLTYTVIGVVKDASGDLSKLQAFASANTAWLNKQPLSLESMQQAFAGCARLSDCATTAWTAGPAYTAAKSTLLSQQWLPSPTRLKALASLVSQCAPADAAYVQWVRWSGAMAQANPAVAFPFRDPAFECQISAVTGARDKWGNGGSFDGWVGDMTALLGERRAAYFNHCEAEVTRNKELYFGAAWPRLQQIKAAYDPNGVFSPFQPADQT